ncbi:MAG: hypothetical protein ACR2GZ_09000 [Solirubrobacteraceae bacterium]
MGLLDDAIREHLDLQRRRGADPTEVQRAEREALGPVRRAPESPVGTDDGVHDPADFELEPGASEAEPEAAAPGPASEPEDYESEVYEAESYEPATEVARPPLREPAFDQEADSWSYEESQPAPDAAPLPPGRAEPAPAESPPAEPAPAEPPLAEPGEDDHRAESPAAPPPHPGLAGIGGETQEYDVEAALSSEPKRDGAESEDVLEETPEFLQDTPDHDRLWFEQRPPKDFDFDG